MFNKHEFDDAVPRIYEKVMGIPFDDPEWITQDNLGKTEWDILQEVCEEVCPDEKLAFEMMYSLIDTENRATGLNQRKDILEKLESIISHTFYKDEPDATQYYTEKMMRKKKFGGKYNEKFLDYTEQTEEEAGAGEEEQ